MEETNYHRASSPSTSPQSDFPTDVEALHSQSLDQKVKEKRIFQGEASTEQGEVIRHEYNRKTYIQKLALFQKSELRQPSRLAGMMLRPLIYLSFPVVLYAGFSYGSNLVVSQRYHPLRYTKPLTKMLSEWFNVLNGTTSLILAGKPYNFASSMVGLSYLSPLLGVFIGSAYAGKLGDRVVIWMARRNGGIMEPEHRLWMFTASLVLVPGSLLLWGMGAAHGVHWFGLVFAMGIIAATNTIGLQVSVAYCIDSYRSLSGEAVVTVILVRNTMSCKSSSSPRTP